MVRWMLDPFSLFCPAVAIVVRQALDLFGKLFIRCCEYGQVDIELFSFAVANMVRRMLNPLSLSPLSRCFDLVKRTLGCPHSLFRSGQVNVGLCLLSHRCDFGQANVNSHFLVERARQSPWEAFLTSFLFLSPRHMRQANVNSHFLVERARQSPWEAFLTSFLFLSPRHMRQVNIGSSSSAVANMVRWMLDHSFLLFCCFDLVRQTVVSFLYSCSLFRSGQVSTEFSPFTVSIWSGECGMFLFPSILLFRSGQADSRFLSLLLFTVSIWSGRQSFPLLYSCSLFRSGQVSTEFSPFTVSIWLGECGILLSFSMLLLRCGQADR
ncbi:hypothetical protein KFK09_007745 [Dendrobium nobile]|uniref:Uncharacterized protein n=1 Tax=Dendrobium nobile TaxID=94219 RepID=A0A8T3BY03_DENNO|nr:hypothetical protein KFK09_007745 [Dendrobium nobile]